MKIIESVETKKVWGPRGDYYEWCYLMENGTLKFGDEQGNYAGGETLSETSHPFSETYMGAVKKRMKFYRETKRNFYDDIILAMERRKDLFGWIIESLDEESKGDKNQDEKKNKKIERKKEKGFGHVICCSRCGKSQVTLYKDFGGMFICSECRKETRSR